LKEAPLFEGKRNRRERAKSEGLVAGDIMTSPVITIGPTATLAQAAWKMQRVKRLPVVDDQGALVGIVSRTDLLTVFLRSDEEIKRDVIEGTIRKTMWIDPDRFRITVNDGIVILEGQVERVSMIPVLVGLVRAVDGVVGVEDRLSYEVDDVNVHPEIVTPWGIYSGALRPGR
jgi:CBS-domain-containing membrane protein